MSAQWAPRDDRDDQGEGGRTGSRLRAVAPPPPRMARLPFLLVLIGVFGLGMAGLLMLNTTLQNQAFHARALDRQAAELTYAQAALEDQLDIAAAPVELARRASALGLRPNPYPAFLEVPSGKVIGNPAPVTGAEAPNLVIKTPAERKAAKAAHEARVKAKAKAEAAKQAEIEAAKKAKAKAEAAKKKAAAEKKAEAQTKAEAEKKAAAKKRAAAKKKAND